MDTAIKMATAPPKTPAFNMSSSSPDQPHPFMRPESGKVTIKHWIYDLQKNSWLFNEKTIRYESSITTLLTQAARKRKLLDLGMEIHTSWVNLMLHLGLVIAQEAAEQQTATAGQVTNLAVATGMTDVIADLDSNDTKRIYMQGEKYLLGYGVSQSFEMAYARFEV